MKIKNAIIGISALAIMLAASSCSTNKDSSFAQRKYYNFPRSEGGKAGVMNQREGGNTNVVIAERKEKTVSSKAIAQEMPMKVNLEKSTAITGRANEPKKSFNTIREKSFSATTETAIEQKRFSPVKIKKLPKKMPADDAMMIIIVLCCIFIPPLGVYLKQRSATNWFWITLLLFLLSCSVFWFAFGAMGWFVAMIIALLVAFDVIS